MVKAAFALSRWWQLHCCPFSIFPPKISATINSATKLEEDIVATSKISVVDPEGTQALKDKEAARVPVVVRYYTNAADEVEARFRQSFVTTREEFSPGGQ